MKLNDGAIRSALGDPDTPGLVLFIIALQAFGPAVMGDPDNGIEMMDSAEMWADLNSLYQTWVTEEGENKLNAIITGLRDGQFWADLDVFMAVTTALFDGDLGDMIDTGFEDLTSTEIMWAMLEMGLAWDGDEPEFSWPIQQYINEQMALEQEDQTENAMEVDAEYKRMLDKMRELGIPASTIRLWDEEYAEFVTQMEDGVV